MPVEFDREARMRVGFIGLGSQGAPMARKIIGAGYETTLWARRPSTLEPFAGSGAQLATSPLALAQRSDLVCLCVVGDADVAEVVDGPEGVLAGLGAGSVVAVHSTVHPETCRELARRAAAKGVAVVDAPVSGGGSAAAKGRLLMMVGGEEDAVARCRPVFETYGDPIVHLGGVGAGQIAKLLNNLVYAANLGIAEGALVLADSLGVRRERLLELAASGSANSFALGTLRGVGGSLERLAPFAGPLLQKDVRLAAQLVEDAAARPGAVFEAADAALRSLRHPR